MLEYKIGISLIPGIGDITAKKLIAYCGGVEAVFREKKSALQKIPGIGTFFAGSVIAGREQALEQANAEVGFIEKHRICARFFLDDDYPARLKHCIDGPVMIYCLGNADYNAPRVLSVVGTRSATTYGKECCSRIIEDLKSSNVLIVSGLAYGIDTWAHREALRNGLATVGVLAHGLDTLYPAANKSMASKMLSQGGLITEFTSGTIPDKENFPKRNRIIAGLADATLVVEAARKGGALITADIANSYNRDVFAVPGRIIDPYSEGCNRFIRTNKAALVQSAADIKYLMGWEEQSEKPSQIQKKLFINLSPDEEAVVALIRTAGELTVDKICLGLQLNTSRVATALLNLEFEGIVKCKPGKIYCLC